MSLNLHILIGRLGKDAVTHTFSESGDTISKFPLATTESWKDKTSGEWKEKTYWHNIVVRRDTEYKKGDMVQVTGKVTTRSYDDKDGNKRYVTETVAQTCRKLATGTANENAQHSSAAQTPAAQPNNAKTPADDGDMGDLPF